VIAAATSSRETFFAARSAGRIVMTSWVSFCPLSWTSRTPSISRSAGSTVDETCPAKSDGSASEAIASAITGMSSVLPA
jgi:hypothetical protein